MLPPLPPAATRRHNRPLRHNLRTLSPERTTIFSCHAPAPSQALAGEGLGLYFARRCPEVAQRLWAELLRLVLAAGGPMSTASQLFYLSDRTTAAVMQRWPEDRVRQRSLGRCMQMC